MLEAFALALKAHPGISLHLVGDGSQKAQLEALCAERGITESVTFVAPPARVIDEIAKYDIFINASHAEGMSNSMLEALALGKAIITTPVSGADEIVDEGVNGYVATAYTPEAMAKCIEDVLGLVDRQGEKLHAYNLAKTRDVFGSDVIAERYETLYRRLIG